MGLADVHGELHVAKLLVADLELEEGMADAVPALEQDQAILVDQKPGPKRT